MVLKSADTITIKRHTNPTEEKNSFFIRFCLVKHRRFPPESATSGGPFFEFLGGHSAFSFDSGKNKTTLLRTVKKGRLRKKIVEKNVCGKQCQKRKNAVADRWSTLLTFATFSLTPVNDSHHFVEKSSMKNFDKCFTVLWCQLPTVNCLLLFWCVIRKTPSPQN